MLFDSNGQKDHVNIGNRGMDDAQAQRILDFLQGAVYCWCKNRPDEEFSVQLLFGEENGDWAGVPIQELYNHRVDTGTSDPVTEAGKDCGHFLRRMLQDDPREFAQTETKFPGQGYRWRRS